ncbi:hypothetical protein Z043_114411 [Scleropages formosus]|uniref:protein-tyrosine-phosphatase n=1 Tax=Scleropages formosus TaxID=113540 RepID=A0A0P7UZ61_SCLFO|nr:uncharacterized protein LOC108920243 [Scleropages formosus]KPP67050.1 hypothetical protein Z043_114411 [Scleropages formosus]
MPPLPLDERIVVIQRPKTLPLRVGSPQPTPQHPARGDPPAPSSQTQPRPHSSFSQSLEGKRSPAFQWRAGEVRAVPAEDNRNTHSRGDGALTLGPGRQKHRHTLDIKLSLGSGGGSCLEGGLCTGSLTGRKEKKLSLHLDLRKEDWRAGGTFGRSSEAVQQLQNPPWSQSKAQGRGHHLKPTAESVAGVVPTEGRHSLRKTRDIKLLPGVVSSGFPSEDLGDASPAGDKDSFTLRPVHQSSRTPTHSLSRHFSSATAAHHTSVFSNPYPAAITALPSHAPPQLRPLSSQPHSSRGRQHLSHHLLSLPLSPSSSRGGGFPSPDHSCTIDLLHPFSCGCWRLVRRSEKCQGDGGSPSSSLSHSKGAGGRGEISTPGAMGLKTLGGCLSATSTTNTSSSNSTASDCRAGLLGPLRCASCSGHGAGFESPAAFRKKLLGGCLPCGPLLTSGPLRALHSCVTGCNPKASQTGSSTCSYCSSDPIVVTYNPRRTKPPGVGEAGGVPARGRFLDEDDDYSVRTIWPEELAQKMTRSKTKQDHLGMGTMPGPSSQYHSSSNGTSPVILDCRNLLEFSRSQLADHAGRRRLQQGRDAVLDFIGSSSSRDAGRDSLKRLWPKTGDVETDDTNSLDDGTGHRRSFSPRPISPSSPLSFSPPSSAHATLTKPKTWERGTLPSARSLHLVLNSLNREQNEENMKVHLSLPLSSSLPTSLSDEGLMTPDVENAVVSPILPFLFLGNERDAQDLDLLLRLNVGFVVNVTTHLPLYHLDSGLIRYKRLPATDNSKQNLRQYFEEVFEFIEEAHQSGRGVLVHCQAGVSRSATIVIAYLMKHTRMTMMDAYKYVRSRRPVVSPNLNFMGQLLEFERDLNAGVTPRILTPKLSGLETQV